MGTYSDINIRVHEIRSKFENLLKLSTSRDEDIETCLDSVEIAIDNELDSIREYVQRRVWSKDQKTLEAFKA